MNELIGNNITTISGNKYYVILYENDFPGFFGRSKTWKQVRQFVITDSGIVLSQIGSDIIEKVILFSDILNSEMYTEGNGNWKKYDFIINDKNNKKYCFALSAQLVPNAENERNNIVNVINSKIN